MKQNYTTPTISIHALKARRSFADSSITNMSVNSGDDDYMNADDAL